MRLSRTLISDTAGAAVALSSAGRNPLDERSSQGRKDSGCLLNGRTAMVETTAAGTTLESFT
jgi:hypothetical protein